MLDLSSRKVYGALAEQCVGGDAKADKVENATSGHLAGLDSNGNLTDSGVSPTEDVTVEGNPVTFDLPFEQDAKSVVVSVKPIQDLHGYDHPWPAGGGKNKFATSFTQKNIQYIECDEFVVPADEYVFKFKNISSSAIAFWASDSSDITDTAIYIVNAGQAANVTYTVGSGGKVKFEMRYNPSEEGITPSSISEVALYLSNDVPASYEPYSNICPISGIDEVEIEVSGKNLCEKTFRGFINTYNSINIDNDSESAVFYAHAGQTYCLSSSVTAERNSIGLVSTDNIVSGMPVLDTDSADNNVWTATWTGWTVWYAVPRVSADFEATCQIELGSIPTAYEPYTGHTTTIPLPSTLYDGGVDVTGGSATDDFIIETFDGSDDEVWEEDASHVYSVKLSGVLQAWKSDVECVSNEFEYKGTAIGASYMSNAGLYLWYNPNMQEPSTRYALIRNNDMSLAELKAYLAEHPLQVCYELATPTILSFTPADVELLEGTNVVSTNAEKVAVKYGRSLWQDIDKLKTDTEGKLNKSDVATIEGDTASRPYSVNEFMLRADGLYKVTQPIAQNASITASNTTKTTIGAVLTALLNA